MVTTAKMIAFEHLYEKLKWKDKNKKLYRLGKMWEWRAHDMDQVQCIKDKNNEILVEKAYFRWGRSPRLDEILVEFMKNANIVGLKRLIELWMPEEWR